MVFTHKQAIAKFVTGYSFGLPGDPTTVLEVVPLCLILASERPKYGFDLQYQVLNP